MTLTRHLALDLNTETISQLAEDYDIPLVGAHLISSDAKVGAFAYVWQGIIEEPISRREHVVALKSLFLQEGSSNGEPTRVLYRRLVRELKIWSRLRHPNVMPLLGMRPEDDPKPPSIITPWMRNGTLRTYMSNYPNFQFRGMLVGIASGIAYLHSLQIVHADLRPDNILISSVGEPQISDFGLSFLKDQEDGSSQTILYGNPRWLAPECIDPVEFGLTAHNACSQQSDMYALGMIIYEMSCGKIPFAQVKQNDVVPLVMDGGRPEYPGESALHRGMDDELWSLTQRCWITDRSDRPTITALLDILDGSDQYQLPGAIGDVQSHPNLYTIPGSSMSENIQARIAPSVYSRLVQYKLLELNSLCRRMKTTLHKLDRYARGPVMCQSVRAAEIALNRVLLEADGAWSLWFRSQIRLPSLIMDDLTRWRDRIWLAVEDYTIMLFQEMTLGRLSLSALIEEHIISENLRLLVGEGYTRLGSCIPSLVDRALQQTPSIGQELDAAKREAFIQSLNVCLTCDIALEPRGLPGTLSTDNSTPIVGRAADVTRGSWTTISEGEERRQVVAIKHLRTRRRKPLRPERFMRAGCIWRLIAHPNVLPFYWVDTTGQDRVVLVSMWAEGGTVMEYLGQHPETSRSRIVKEVASGLAYLHRCDVVHGSILSTNVMIDSTGTARITDYGLAIIALVDRDGRTAGLTQAQKVSIFRWMAPELSMERTFATDVFTLARTIFHIMTGEEPFAHMNTMQKLLDMLMHGELSPERPTAPVVLERGLTDEVWELLLEMWRRRPDDRPEMPHVDQELGRLL